MIHFSLCCDGHHRFDGWFRNNDDFEKQRASGLVCCPICGSAQVEKALMTPAIANSDKREGGQSLVAGREQKFWRHWQDMARKIREKADYVGEDFVDEARKIHFGEVEPRAIYGEAQAVEVASLLEDGVEVMPLPPLPEEQN